MSKPRAPRLSTEAVRKSIDADNQIRRDRTNAKRRERAAQAKADAQALKDAAEAAADQRQALKDRTAEREAVVESQFVDFKALGHTEAATRWDLTSEDLLAFIAFMDDNGFDALGQPKPVDDEPQAAAKTSNAQYIGPMLALKDAVKHYVKGTNGNPHCNDPVAALLGSVSRETTVKVIGALLFTKGIITTSNPYSHLNPGQQSMNMRNKLRGAMKSGFVAYGELIEALAAAKESK